MEVTRYTKDALESVQAGAFLSKADETAISQMSDELQENWEKQQRWRTETEMRISVLNDVKHPDNASKYWQAVREMGVFFEQLALLSFDYRRNEVAIRRIEKKVAQAEDELAKAEAQIDLDEAHFKRRNMELAAKDRVRELKLWSKLKEELNDGTFNDKDVNADQLQSYQKRFNIETEIAKAVGNASPEARNLTGLAITTKRVSEQKQLGHNQFKMVGEAT